MNNLDFNVYVKKMAQHKLFVFKPSVTHSIIMHDMGSLYESSSA